MWHGGFTCGTLTRFRRRGRRQAHHYGCWSLPEPLAYSCCITAWKLKTGSAPHQRGANCTAWKLLPTPPQPEHAHVWHGREFPCGGPVLGAVHMPAAVPRRGDTQVTAWHFHAIGRFMLRSPLTPSYKQRCHLPHARTKPCSRSEPLDTQQRPRTPAWLGATGPG